MKFWEAMKALEEGKKVCLWKLPSYKFDSVKRMILEFTNRDGDTVAELFNSGWELFEEPEQLLSFADVVKGLREGKRFRRKAWVNEFAAISGDRIVESEEEGTEFLITMRIKDFEADDWVELK